MKNINYFIHVKLTKQGDSIGRSILPMIKKKSIKFIKTLAPLPKKITFMLDDTYWSNEEGENKLVVPIKVLSVSKPLAFKRVDGLNFKITDKKGIKK